MEVSLPSRSFGNSALRCTAIGLGTGKLRSASTGLSGTEAVRLIHHAAAQGVNFIDTADSYGQGESEMAVGRAIRGQREKFVIATKAGFRFSAAGPLIRIVKPLLRGLVRRFAGAERAVSRARSGSRQMGVLRQNFAPTAIVSAVEASLRRLGTDYLDVFFLHEATLDAVQDGDLWNALLKLRAAGKLRHLGISSNEPAVLEAALALPDLSAIETAVNPARPDNLWPLLEKFSVRGVGVIANQVFRGGRLFAEHTEEKSAAHRVQLAAQDHGLTPRQLLLAFALGAPGVASALVGTTKPVHLDENLADLRVLAARPAPDWAALRKSLQTENFTA